MCIALKLDGLVDYHIHTTCSDGQMHPADVVRQASQLGYRRIAITDHDNMEGIAEALAASEETGLEVIPGIEIATETEEGIGLHMLGYGYDVNSASLRDFLHELILRRRERNRQLLAVLREMGYDITEADLRTGPNSFVGKPIFARALVEKGYIAHEQLAFGREILGSEKARAVKKVKPLASEAMQAIRDAGGTPVLAHPIQTRHIGRPGTTTFYEHIEQIIARLVDQGLQGLECYHPDQDIDQSARFVDMARRYGLIITRGSDFHGRDYAEADPTAPVPAGDNSL